MKRILILDLFLIMMAVTGSAHILKGEMNDDGNINISITKDGAEAVKAFSLQQINQTKVPTVHNLKLDKMLRKFAETPEKRKKIEKIIDSAYKENGTYLGSALMQHIIDVQNFIAFVGGKIKIMKTINPDIAEIIEKSDPKALELIKNNSRKLLPQVVKDISPRIMDVLSSTEHNPTAEEMSETIDIIVENHPLLTSDDAEWFARWWWDCSAPFSGMSVQEKSDMIAKKTYLMDLVIFLRVMKNAGVLKKSSTSDEKKIAEIDFIEWMDSASLFTDKK